jgi:hypothetical protein
MKKKKIFILYLGGVVLYFFGTFFGFVLLNYIVDPLQVLRKATLYPPLFSRQQRFQNPGLAKNYTYDTVIIGNSLTENIYPSKVRKIFGHQAIKLSMSGSTLYEQNLILRLALSTKKVKTVIWGLDPKSVSTPPNAVREDFGPFPYYLYKTNSLRNLYPYLLNISNLKSSIQILASSFELPLRGELVRNLEKLNTLDKTHKFGLKQVLSYYCKRKAFLDKYPRKSLREEIQVDHVLATSNLKENYLKLVQSYPDVIFYTFTPPYSFAKLALYRDSAPKLLENIMRIRELILSKAYIQPNIRLHDFQATEKITRNFENYIDLEHYSTETATYILESFMKGRHRIDPANPLKTQSSLKDQIQSYQIPESFSNCAD